MDHVRGANRSLNLTLLGRNQSNGNLRTTVSVLLTQWIVAASQLQQQIGYLFGFLYIFLIHVSVRRSTQRYPTSPLSKEYLRLVFRPPILISFETAFSTMTRSLCCVVGVRASVLQSTSSDRMMLVLATFSRYPFLILLQLITSLLKPMEEHTEDAQSEEAAARLPVGCSSFCLRIWPCFLFPRWKLQCTVV